MRIEFMRLWVVLWVGLMLTGCSREPAPATPRAEILQGVLGHQADAGSDPYAYLVNPDHPDTVKYLRDEARYLETVTGPWEDRVKQMMSEINAGLLARVKTSPVLSGRFELYSETAAGQQYPVFYRRPAGEDSDWQVILDLNELAGGSDYFHLGGFVTSPDERKVAFTEDRRGAGRYTLKVRDLVTGDIGTHSMAVGPGLAWTQTGLLFVSLDEHAVIEIDGAGQQRVIYAEADPAFAVSVRNARDRDKAIITTESHQATEIHVYSTDRSRQVIAPRRSGHRYRALVDGGITVLSNFRQPGFELAMISEGQTDPGSWTFVGLDNPGEVVDFERSGDMVVMQVRRALRDEIILTDLAAASSGTILKADAGERLQIRLKTEESIEFTRHSLLHPEQVFVLDTSSGMVHEREPAAMPAGYGADDYRVEERWLAARDGEKVPVTLLYRAGPPLNERPLYLNAYGAYGISLPVTYDSTRLPLLNRGFVIGFIHARGGGELGAQWHAAGRRLTKKNTFNDVIDVTRGLLESGVGNADMLVARGASAGGTIVGVLANEVPSLYRVLVADVPFLDVVGSLQDLSQPLTPSDRLEWGNPENSEVLAYMLQYSPYHNVQQQVYPHMLVQAAGNDGRVEVHEAIRWMAKIREHNSGDRLQLIDIETDSGHLGASDQYLRRRKQALEYVFILQSLGMKD